MNKMKTENLIVLQVILFLFHVRLNHGFSSKFTVSPFVPQSKKYHERRTHLSMEKLDVITNIRTEWISSALCTNQTPRSANVALQLGCYDGRAIIALPRSIGIFITSSNEADGEISVSLQRQLKEQRDLRFNRNDAMDVNDLELDCMQISFQDQRADDLNQVEDESVDVVISLQSADRMEANGLDWRKSVNETISVNLTIHFTFYSRGI